MKINIWGPVAGTYQFPVWAPTTLGPAESPSLCLFAFFASQLCIFCIFPLKTHYFLHLLLFLPLWGFLPRPRLIRFRLEKDAKEAKKAKKAKKAVFFNRKRQKNQTWKAKKGKKPEAGRLRQRWPGLARSARAQVCLGLSPSGPRAEPVWAPTTLGPAESPSLWLFAFFCLPCVIVVPFSIEKHSFFCLFCFFCIFGASSPDPGSYASAWRKDAKDASPTHPPNLRYNACFTSALLAMRAYTTFSNSLRLHVSGSTIRAMSSM